MEQEDASSAIYQRIEETSNIRRKSWTCACHLLSQKEEAYYQYTLMKFKLVLLSARFIFLKLPGLKKR